MSEEPTGHFVQANATQTIDALLFQAWVAANCQVILEIQTWMADPLRGWQHCRYQSEELAQLLHALEGTHPHMMQMCSFQKFRSTAGSRCTCVKRVNSLAAQWKQMSLTAVPTKATLRCVK